MVFKFFSKLGIPWEYCTRAIGVGLIGYGVLVDKSGDRGTIILAGVGFIGGEFVAKSEPVKRKNGT